MSATGSSVLLTGASVESWVVNLELLLLLFSTLRFEEKVWKELALALAQDHNLAFMQS